MIDYHDYMGKEIKIIDKAGDTFEGKLISYDIGLEEDPELEYDSIGIQLTGSKEHYIGIPIPDIKEVTIIN